MRPILALVWIICSWASAVSGASPDINDIRSYVATNAFLLRRGYSNYWESIQATNLAELYEKAGDGGSAYPVLLALVELKSQGKTLDPVTVEFVKRVALKTSDKETVEPIATSLVLPELGVDEAVDFGNKISSKANPRSLQILMRWICDKWNDGGLKNHPEGDDLVMASLSQWKTICESPGYVQLEPKFVKMLRSPPFSEERHVAKAQELVVKLLENMHNLSNGPLFPLVYYLVSQTNTALVGQEPLGLVSKGPIQRAKVVLWILSDRYPTNSVATNVLSRIEGLRPELGGYMKQLRAGEIDEIKGVQEPQLELWQLYEKKSLKPK